MNLTLQSAGSYMVESFNKLSREGVVIRNTEVSCFKIRKVFDCARDKVVNQRYIVIGTRFAQVILYGYIVAFKGDWKYLVQLFNLVRSSQRDEARPLQRIWESMHGSCPPGSECLISSILVTWCLNKFFGGCQYPNLEQVCWKCGATKGVDNVLMSYVNLSLDAPWRSIVPLLGMCGRSLQIWRLGLDFISFWKFVFFVFKK